MAGKGNDVGALFKSFGAGDGGYRELVRKADASEAEERWPLLKAIPPEKHDAPPALSRLQKNQLWNSPEKPAPRMREAARGPGLGEKLARNLQQMSVRSMSDAPAPRPMARAAAETPRQPAHPAAPKPGRPASQEGRGLFAPSEPPVPLFERPAAPKPARLANQARGLFAQNEPAPAQRKPAAGSAGDSLASTFKRLAGNEEAMAETGSSRPAFMKRLSKG